MRQIINLLKQIKALPVCSIFLSKNDKEGARLFKLFNKRHPKMPLVRKKSIGIALVKIKDFENAEAYMKSVNGKNSAAYFSRKAIRTGYQFKQFNANEYVDAIHDIHWSSSERQGKKLSAAYEQKTVDYPVDDNNVYYGVFLENKLVAYCWCLVSGELQIMNRIMGHSNHLNAGVMYLLVTKIVEHILLDDTSGVKYVMYDTMLGASEGLKMFKKRCGFIAYRVKWLLA